MVRAGSGGEPPRTVGARRSRPWGGRRSRRPVGPSPGAHRVPGAARDRAALPVGARPRQLRGSGGQGAADMAEEVLQRLVWVYADRPDFPAEWLPEVPW